MTVLARLGLVLYWLGTALAVIGAGLALFLYNQEGRADSISLAIALLFAAGVCIIGRACRYILAGT